MNRGRNRTAGYTIVETLIFLAVSGVLFISAMALISGQQAKTEFTTSVRDFELKLTTISNNVATGYYTNTNTFNCDDSDSNGLVEINSGTNTQGANEKCIFIGRVIQFAPGGDKEKYSIYTAAGSRYTAGGADSESFLDANPQLVAPSTAYPSRPPAIDTASFGGGVTVEKVEYNDSGSPGLIGGIGFFSALKSNSVSADVKAGTLNIDVIAPKATALGQTATAFADNMNTLTASNTINSPSGGIRICLKSNGTNQYAWLSLGSTDSGKLTTSVEFKSGGVCS